MYLTTTVLQTPKNHEVDLAVLKALCYQSARLYNASLYNIRQHYFATTRYLSYNDNWRMTKDDLNYRLLISDSAQQIMRMADRDMQSFFKLLYLKSQGKYSARVNLPHYKKGDECSTYVVCGRSVRIQKDGTVNIGVTREFREKYGYDSRYIKFTIPRNLRDVKEFKEVRINPQYGATQFCVQFIYESAQAPQQASGDGWMSIDLGLDNLMACTTFSNGGSRQFLIDGRRLKHINRYYNKEIAHLKAARPDKFDLTKRMIRLMNGRKNRISQYFDCAVKYVVGECLALGVTRVVVGHNEGWKQEVNLKDYNNQNFTYIPHYLLLRKLRSKCEFHGIKFLTVEESYTSKASCLDMDEIPTCTPNDQTKYKFSGRRKYRGLYKSKEGLLINADINGAVNILRKYFVNGKLDWIFQDSVRALVNAPCPRVHPLGSSPRTSVVGS